MGSLKRFGQVDIHVCIPMADGGRSLNIVTAAAMVAGEALRQNDLFPFTKRCSNNFRL